MNNVEGGGREVMIEVGSRSWSKLVGKEKF